MTTIPLPPLCVTLLPPWPQAILYAGKRLENRSAGVAAQIGSYRGLVGLTQSKGYGTQDPRYRRYTPKEWAEDQAGLVEDHFNLKRVILGRHEEWKKTAGKLFIVADLIRIDRPHEARGNPWHVEGQHGLIFGKVWEVEPVKCTGTQGAWAPRWCANCNHILAAGARVPNACYSCKTRDPKHGPGVFEDRPQLRVVREVLP